MRGILRGGLRNGAAPVARTLHTTARDRPARSLGWRHYGAPRTRVGGGLDTEEGRMALSRAKRVQAEAGGPHRGDALDRRGQRAVSGAAAGRLEALVRAAITAQTLYAGGPPYVGVYPPTPPDERG